MTKWHPLCPESIRWAAVQLSDELIARGLDYGSEGEVADLARAVNKRLATEWNRLERERRENRCWYFGTWPGSRGGHYFFDRYGNSSAGDTSRAQPFSYPDGTYQPDNGQIEGPAALRYKDGWTILAWWDRTEDSRPGCCSALILEGQHGFETMVEALKERYPRVYARRPLTRFYGKTRQEARRS